ncbi:MAG: methyltransferase domain-containing protein [Vicingaceae bacterium]|jgi:SAM-dependent methyltransferase|nr:methyltransferase domain-containing protein [Vicingaceae bacterium]
MNKDAVGAALLDYFNNNYSEDIIVKSSISEDDIISVPYLFRSEDEFPYLEKIALKHCKGKVLDVGAGGGCHSLFLKENGFDVEAIDISEGAVKVMSKRGVSAELANFYDVTEKYDTLLFLMNGLGLAEDLKGLSKFLLKAKSLLNTNGQILLDSSDIKYMFEEEDGSVWVDLNNKYYGEVTYQMQYKGIITDQFNWLFVDFEKLREFAASVDLKTELLYEDDSNQYLAKLTL